MFTVRLYLARFIARANDSHSRGFEIESDAPLQGIWESNGGEAILARRRGCALNTGLVHEVVAEQKSAG